MWLHVAEVCSSLTFTDWIQAPKLDSVKLKPLPDKVRPQCLQGDRVERLLNPSSIAMWLVEVHS